MDEFSTYLATQVKNRQVFLLNFAGDLQVFVRLFGVLRSSWSRLGNERDRSGQSHVGLLPFANILIRHALVGFEHLSCYQSFLAWLAFRPGLEALLMVGKFADDPENARIWKNRMVDRKSYQKAFSGDALDSKSLPQTGAFRQVLGHLNDEFMHPNPNFTYRDSTQRDEGNAVLLEIQCFDTDPDVHEAHVLAYVNIMDLIARASEEMVNNLCGAPALASAKEEYANTQLQRATSLAGRNNIAKAVMKELGLWKV